MNLPKNEKTKVRCNNGTKSSEQTPTSHERPMHIPSVTQITPENNTSSGEKIVPTGKAESPSQQELEQDVAATNPSIESMQSRG